MFRQWLCKHSWQLMNEYTSNSDYGVVTERVVGKVKLSNIDTTKFELVKEGRDI